MDISKLDSDKNVMQNVKQRFFALRNGLLADMLRRGGSPFRIIFGLNLPQLKEIAGVFGTDDGLAEALWANVSTRESRLLAPMVADADAFGHDRAMTWLASASGSLEELDVLCHALLRKLPYGRALVDELAGAEDAQLRYAALRLMMSFVSRDPVGALALAEAELERGEALTAGVARQLKEEAEFLLNS